MFFRKQTNNELNNIDQDIKNLLIDHKLNILTIDKNYHDLFPTENKNRKIVKLEQNLNDLLKEQGRLNTEHKKITKFKKQVMDEIVKQANMKLTKDNEEINTQLEKLKGKVEEINKRLEDIEERIIHIPEDIVNANMDLFIESVKLCYNRMDDRKSKKENLNNDINQIRNMLKEKILKKQEIEEELDGIYASLHNIAGVDVVNELDEFFGGKDG